MSGDPVRALLVGTDATLGTIVPDLRSVDAGIAVETATTSTDALESIDDDDGEPLDCVVTAHELPDSDGVTLLRAVRERYPDLPVLLYAGDGSEAVASDAISADVTDYVPTDLAAERPDVLANRIANAVTHHRTETELAERERQLETLIGNLPGVVYRCRPGSDWAMEVLRGDCEALVGYDPETILDGDVSWGDIVHPDDRDDALESIRDQLAADDRFRVTYRVRTRQGARRWIEDRGSAVYATADGGEQPLEIPSSSTDSESETDELGPQTGDGELVAVEGFCMDVTARKQREQELERYETVLETIPDGAYVLDESYCFRLVNDALVSMTGRDREELLGTHISVIDDEAMSNVERLRSELAAGVRDVATMETQIRRADGERFPAEVRFTTLPPDDDEPDAPSDDAAAEFRGTAGVIRDTSERKARKRQLERQREQLTTINQLHRVQEDITRSIIELSSREEMERRVCERLAETDLYRFAWIGGIDRSTKRIEPRAAAGVEAGYLEEITITVDESETGQGPAGEAVRTGELQVTEDLLMDPDFEPWRDAAIEREYRSVAAVPLTYGGSTYGVLNVYTERENAFDGHEREILAGLGEIIGHAISARQRTKTLLSDVVREVQFRASELESPLVEASAGRDCTIEIERLVPTDGNAFVHFLDVEGIDPDEFERAMTATEDVTDVSAITPTDDAFLFEVTIRDPPLTQLFAERGGRLRSVRIEDGELYCTAELPPDVDVRGAVEAVQEDHPELEVIAQRTRRTEDRSVEEFRTRVLESLTEKQRRALETAYSAGFFDWPREQSGEDVAETLGIAPATFSQHLRTAQRKVMEALLADDSEERG